MFEDGKQHHANSVSIGPCLSNCFGDVKRNRDQGNSYKRNNLTGDFIIVLEVQFIIIMVRDMIEGITLE